MNFQESAATNNLLPDNELIVTETHASEADSVTIKLENGVSQTERFDPSQLVVVDSSGNAPAPGIIKLESQDFELNVYDCEKCRKQFNQEDQLVKHIKLCHDGTLGPDGKKIWKCDQCRKTFSSRKNSIYHQWTHTNKRPYSCSICQKDFICSSHLAAHQAVHREDRPFTCPLCLQAFKTRGSLRQHEQATKGNCVITSRNAEDLAIYKCHNCPKQFYLEYDLAIHVKCCRDLMIGPDGTLRYSCSQCDKSYNSRRGLNRHTMSHERPYSCSICQKRFSRRCHLVAHQVVHGADRPFSCAICRRRYKLKKTLQQHQRLKKGNCLRAAEVSGPSDEATVSATIELENHVSGTNDYSPSTINLENDLSRMGCDSIDPSQGEDSELNVYKCDKCSKQFNQETQLVKHIIGSCHDNVVGPDGKRMWGCTICDKTFAYAYALVVHLGTHTSDRPYSCSICHERFTKSKSLVNHQAVHQKDRPFNCLICGRRFELKGDLQEHERLGFCAMNPIESAATSSVLSDDNRPLDPSQSAQELVGIELTDSVKLKNNIEQENDDCDLSDSSELVQEQVDFELSEKAASQVTIKWMEEDGNSQTYDRDPLDPAQWAQERVGIESSGNAVAATSIELEGLDFGMDVYSCHKCEKQFNYKNQLLTHIRFCKNVVALGPDGFKQKGALRQHERLKKMNCLMEAKNSSGGKGTWTCAECGRTFTCRQGIVRHLRMHTDAKLTCAECGKACTSRMYLVKHVRTHTGTICRKRFSRSSNVVRHQVINVNVAK